MAIRTLKVGSLTIPVHARYSLEQSYEARRAVWQARLANGSMVQRVRWSGKLATTVRGSGRVPSGLVGLDYSAPIDLYCIAGRSISATGTAITIPSTRRTDDGAIPIGRAWVGDTWVETTCAATGTTATLGSVSSATLYQVTYFPKLSCYITPPTEEWQQNGDHTWTLTAEEA